MKTSQFNKFLIGITSLLTLAVSPVLVLAESDHGQSGNRQSQQSQNVERNQEHSQTQAPITSQTPSPSNVTTPTPTRHEGQNNSGSESSDSPDITNSSHDNESGDSNHSTATSTSHEREDGDHSTATTTPGNPPPVNPLVITNATAVVGTSTVKAHWLTNIPATSEVYYSTTSPVVIGATSTQAVATSTLVTDHAVNITNLLTSTLYFFLIQSKDALNNVLSTGQFSLTTGM